MPNGNRWLRFGLVATVVCAAVLAVMWGRLCGRASVTAPRPSAAPVHVTTRQPSDSIAMRLGAQLEVATNGAAARSSNEEIVRTLVQAWTDDPGGLSRWFAALEASRRFELTRLLLSSLAQQDPNEALRLLALIGGVAESADLHAALFSQLAAVDPATAAVRVSALPAGTVREYACRAIADVWVRRDAEAAERWASALAQREREAAYEALSLGSGDPLRAAEIAQRGLSGQRLAQVLAVVLPRVCEVDAAAAGALVPLLPAGEAQTFTAIGVAKALAERAPAEAIAWIEILPAGEARELALLAVVEQWARKDATAAGDFIVNLSAGTLQDAAIERYARIEGRRAPQEAILWLNRLTTPSARDVAAISVASAWAQREPAIAVAWATTLPVGDVQAKALRAAFSYWTLSDPNAARAWLASSALSSTLRAQLNQR